MEYNTASMELFAWTSGIDIKFQPNINGIWKGSSDVMLNHQGFGARPGTKSFPEMSLHTLLEDAEIHLPYDEKLYPAF